MYEQYCSLFLLFCLYNFSSVHKQIRLFEFNKLIGKPSSPLPLLSFYSLPLTLKSVNRTLENVNMQIDDLNIKKYHNPKKVLLVRFHSTYLLDFFISINSAKSSTFIDLLWAKSIKYSIPSSVFNNLPSRLTSLIFIR